jgi:hypothetical protein
MSSSLDDPNKVWISSIRFEDWKVSSFWNDVEFINSWVLTSKPFEYIKQLPSLFDWWWLTRINNYYDITSVLESLQPIAKYKEFLRKKWRIK